MIVAITGIRDLHPASLPVVRERMEQLVLARVKQFRCGGARGIDVEALRALSKLLTEPVERVVYLPFRLSDQPRDAQAIIRRCADRVVEIKLTPVGAAAAYHARNRFLLEGIRPDQPASQAIAFTDGQQRGGTWNTIRLARDLGIPVEEVKVKRL